MGHGHGCAAARSPEQRRKRASEEWYGGDGVLWPCGSLGRSCAEKTGKLAKVI